MTKLNNDNDLVLRGEIRAALMQKAKPLIGGGVAAFVIDDYNKAVDGVQSVDAKPVVRGANIATEYAECDQFICSKCGIHLQDWNLIEDDYEDGIVHEFVFNFCPNCGVDIREGKDKSEDEDE